MGAGVCMRGGYSGAGYKGRMGGVWGAGDYVREYVACEYSGGVMSARECLACVVMAHNKDAQ